MAVRIYTINGKPAISKHNRPKNSKFCTNKMYLVYLRARTGLDDNSDVHSNTIIHYASLILKVGYKGCRFLFFISFNNYDKFELILELGL